MKERVSMLDQTGRMQYLSFWWLIGDETTGKLRKLINSGWSSYTLSDFTQYEFLLIKKFLNKHRKTIYLSSTEEYIGWSEHFNIEYKSPNYTICFANEEVEADFTTFLLSFPARETIMVNFDNNRTMELIEFIWKKTGVGFFLSYDDGIGEYILFSGYDKKALMECKLRWAR